MSYLASLKSERGHKPHPWPLSSVSAYELHKSANNLRGWKRETGMAGKHAQNPQPRTTMENCGISKVTPLPLNGRQRTEGRVVDS